MNGFVNPRPAARRGGEARGASRTPSVRVRTVAVLALLASPTHALAAPPLPPSHAALSECGMAYHLARHPMPPVGHGASGPRADGPLENRDPFAVEGTHHFATHFAIHWGPNGSVDPGTVPLLADAFEEAWTAFVEEMEHVPPYGTDAFFLNVYLGNTGGGTPTIDWGGGYATVDAQGFPYIVLHPSLLDLYRWGEAYGEYPDSTAAHEFYHCIQSTVDTYPYFAETGWYWEATANWSVPYVWPEYTSTASGVATFAMLPHYPLYHFDYPDQGTFIEGRHYAAQVFPRFLTLDVADWTVVRDSWSPDGGWDDPIDALDALLAPWGTGVDAAFADFAARSAVWDMSYGTVYADDVSAVANAYPEEDHQFAARVPIEGTDGYVGAPEQTAPYSYGYNLVAMDIVPDGALTFGFRGAELGSRGSPANWRVTVVRMGRREAVYEPMALTTSGGFTVGERLVEDASDDSSAYLVVSTHPEVHYLSERFAYEYLVVPEPFDTEPEDTGEEEEPRGCGCTAGAGGVGFLPLLGVAACAIRLRRTRGASGR